MFHRDAGYLEGRRMRKSRETRAVETRTAFGRELIAGQWAAAEFAVLSRLWQAGAAVPYPVQLHGTQVMMEFIGDDDGVAAPRLAQLRPDRDEAADLFAQMRDVLGDLADAGYTHGDLSPYNVLVHDGTAGADRSAAGGRPRRQPAGLRVPAARLRQHLRVVPGPRRRRRRRRSCSTT